MNPKVDEYIANSADFARPILTHLRKLVHQTVPEIEETMKWGIPHFEYKGPVCSIASFKQHCVFGFWKESLMPSMKQITKKKKAMGSMGRIESLADLPSTTTLRRLIKEAVLLNEQGVKVVKKAKNPVGKLAVPAYFTKVLRTNKQAQGNFDSFSPSARGEYVEWITDAKNEQTREKRIAQAIEWIAEGKHRHWKYMK
jgi:uncharacterized protein YdeI (YjbR/CyaY-like superfamily)